MNYRFVALLALTAALAAAAQADPLAFAGSYRFLTTERGPDGQPVCTETWNFDAPDRMTVTSGEEVVEKRVRTETDRDGEWLVASAISTNGKPDCMGNINPAVAPGEQRTSILRFNNGNILVCPPPGHTDEGIPVHGECYATLERPR